MMLPEEGHLLRIFVGESDRHDGTPLYEWIVRQARERGLAGATVLRGIEGFGAHSRLHTAKILRLSQDLPMWSRSSRGISDAESQNGPHRGRGRSKHERRPNDGTDERSVNATQSEDCRCWSCPDS